MILWKRDIRPAIYIKAASCISIQLSAIQKAYSELMSQLFQFILQSRWKINVRLQTGMLQKLNI